MDRAKIKEAYKGYDDKRHALLFCFVENDDDTAWFFKNAMTDTVKKFTGFIDVNGKFIYDGDDVMWYGSLFTDDEESKNDRSVGKVIGFDNEWWVVSPHFAVVGVDDGRVTIENTVITNLSALDERCFVIG